MPEIKADTITNEKQLNKQERDNLATKIAENFGKWDDDRAAQITMAKKIMTETYLNQSPRKFDEGLEWKSDVKMNALYNIKRTKKSVIWKQMWSSPQQMFEVRGTNDETEEMAKVQKAALVDSLTKMNVGKQYDAAIDNLYDIGEMIFKTDWEQRKKVVKRQKKDLGFVLQQVFRMNTGAGFKTNSSMTEFELPYYENARVESVSPFMFVFDHAAWKIGDKEGWKSLIKISKRFESIEDLKRNPYYDITPQMVRELKEENNESAENKEVADLREMDEYGGKYSVLYAHGDFKVNGKTYKNYIAEVLAGKYLIRFEENPLWVCPFILCALEFDPLTKRGISPLKSVYDMCLKEEELTNTAFDVQLLKQNPCSYANEDLFDEDNTDSDGNLAVAPGKMIKFKNDYAGGKPQPIDVSGEGIADCLTLLDNKIADVSSVSSVMYGNIEDSKRTATELSLADKGSSSQAAKELDTINQDLTIPMIENVAELLAMFKDGVDFVYYQEKGKNIEYKIDNQIRQAQYEYYYEDRNALEDRKTKAEQLYQLFVGAAQLPELREKLDFVEAFTTLVEALGWDNVDKFFKPDTPMQQVFDEMKQLPPEIQQAAVPDLQNIYNQAMQLTQVALQNQQMMQGGMNEQI